MTCESVQSKSRKDPIPSQVLEYSQKGWPESPAEELRAFHQKSSELTIHQGCLMWGMRVIIPPSLRQKVKDQLHAGHIGIVKMKGLARRYVWWPDIDKELECVARECQSCQLILNAPSLAPLHPWMFLEKPWERLNIDFAGPFMGHMFFVVVDAHSKWPEVIVMDSTTSEKTVDVLRELFSRYGVPTQIVSDNGPQFVSQEF